MDLGYLKEVASNENRTETVSFRLAAEDKEALLAFCQQHGLSLGRVMREMVKELLDAEV